MRFNVGVIRTGYAFREILVEAEDEDDAIEKAISKAGNIEFSEHDASYEHDFVEEVKVDGRKESDQEENQEKGGQEGQR